MPREHHSFKLTFTTKWVNSLADVDMFELNTHFFFYKHQVYKHNQPEILVFLNTLLNTSQPQIFEIFLKDFLNLAFSKQKLV